jgi:hypothetical protein
MAALSVSIVGGPMTLAMLMLETTHDFALMGLVLTAALVSSTITREVFGYSFSTWRLHARLGHPFAARHRLDADVDGGADDAARLGARAQRCLHRRISHHRPARFRPARRC